MRENGSHCDLKFMWLPSHTADENWSADYHLLCCSSQCKYSTIPPTAWDLSPSPVPLWKQFGVEKYNKSTYVSVVTDELLG